MCWILNNFHYVFLRDIRGMEDVWILQTKLWLPRGDRMRNIGRYLWKTRQKALTHLNLRYADNLVPILWNRRMKFENDDTSFERFSVAGVSVEILFNFCVKIPYNFLIIFSGISWEIFGQNFVWNSIQYFLKGLIVSVNPIPYGCETFPPPVRFPLGSPRQIFHRHYSSTFHSDQHAFSAIQSWKNWDKHCFWMFVCLSGNALDDRGLYHKAQTDIRRAEIRSRNHLR